MTKKKSTKKRAPTKTAVKKSVTKKPRKPRARPIQREVAVKKYVVRLSSAERERLEEMIGKGKGSAGHLLKARILLKADVSEAGDAWSDSRIIEALDTTPSTVYGTRQQLVEEGCEAVFTRQQRAAGPVERIVDGEKAAPLIALCCGKPPAGRARWSLRLLETTVVALTIVEAASRSTIGRVRKTICSRPIAGNNG